jgi:hypothetical protein
MYIGQAYHFTVRNNADGLHRRLPLAVVGRQSSIVNRPLYKKEQMPAHLPCRRDVD